MSHRNIPELLADVAAHHGTQTAYRFKRGGEWCRLSWSESWVAIRRVARALMASGVERGHAVGILAQTRLEWVLADFGTGCCGGITAGVYPSNLGPDCAYILNHCEAAVLFVENAEQLEKILGVRGELSHLKQIVIMEGVSDPDRGVLSWEAFLALGDDVTEEQLDDRIDCVERADVLSLVYTSGTTGVPKGVMLTHGNLLAVTRSVKASLHVEPHFETLLFLPLAHVFARLIAYMCMHDGVTVAFAEGFHTVPQDLAAIRPHFIVSVPRLFEKARERVHARVEEAGGLKSKLFHWALEVGLAASRVRQQRRQLPPLLRLELAMADRLALHKVRDGFGGRLIYAVSGAAPLNPSVAEFFDACGVLILEGIGMTENTSFSNVNRLHDNRIGTVGPPGPGIEVRIAEDGEVLTRGENTMKGYFKEPEATAEAIDKDGWLHTGDIGEIDEDGFLRITDRKKDLIITAGGKNIAPQRIERILRMSPYISHAMAHGDRRHYISALITLNPDRVQDWAARRGLLAADIPALASHPEVQALIAGEVEAQNQHLASYETVKRFHILPRDFSIEGGELTPTMKIKRKVVTEMYRKELDALYV